MVQRYSVSLYDEEIYQDDDGTFVYYFDYAALEQRFDALSTKFSAMVEENAVLKNQLKPIEDIYGAMKGQNRNEFVYGMVRAIEKAMELKEGE